MNSRRISKAPRTNRKLLTERRQPSWLRAGSESDRNFHDFFRRVDSLKLFYRFLGVEFEGEGWEKGEWGMGKVRRGGGSTARREQEEQGRETCVWQREVTNMWRKESLCDW